MIEINQEQRAQIEALASDTRCPRGFACRSAGFENLPPIRPVAGGKLIECLGDSRDNCRLGLPFGYAYFCTCPLRLHLLKILGV